MSEDIKKTFRKRLFLIYSLAVVFGLACVFRIIYLSVFEDDFKNCVDATKEGVTVDSTCNCVIYENKITPIRGEIWF
jgi:cell division protein FtsI/penicillin-binding protein 2